jgi:hypothetical protein
MFHWVSPIPVFRTWDTIIVRRSLLQLVCHLPLCVAIWRQISHHSEALRCQAFLVYALLGQSWHNCSVAIHAQDFSSYSSTLAAQIPHVVPFDRLLSCNNKFSDACQWASLESIPVQTVHTSPDPDVRQVYFVSIAARRPSRTLIFLLGHVPTTWCHGTSARPVPAFDTSISSQ